MAFFFKLATVDPNEGVMNTLLELLVGSVSPVGSNTKAVDLFGAKIRNPVVLPFIYGALSKTPLPFRAKVDVLYVIRFASKLQE